MEKERKIEFMISLGRVGGAVEREDEDEGYCYWFL